MRIFFKEHYKRFIPSVIFFSVLLISIILINKTPIPKTNVRNGVFYEKAVVTQIIKSELQLDELSGFQTGRQDIKVKITSGEYKGREFETVNYASYSDNVTCNNGTKLIVSLHISGELTTVSIFTYDRTTPLIVLLIVFSLTLCVIGGKKGFKTLLSLVFTFVGIIYLFIPLLYMGVSPVLASILLSVASAAVTLCLIDGWNAKTISAIIGTVICVSLAGALSSISGYFANISTFNIADMDEMTVVLNQSNLNIDGLLFSIILIACLGAVMDICMSVSSTLNEIYINNPEMSEKSLFKAGMNVGKDMMGTMANTLILAFAAGYLTSVIILSSYDITLYEIFSMPQIVSEIIQGISGSIGVFSAVPVVSFIASRMIGRSQI